MGHNLVSVRNSYPGEWGIEHYVCVMLSVLEVNRLSLPVRNSHTAGVLSSHSSPLHTLLLTWNMYLYFVEVLGLVEIFRGYCKISCCFFYVQIKLYWNHTSSLAWHFLLLSYQVFPMVLVSEAWGETSQAQAPMGRHFTQHALLLLQCMLVLHLCSVASRRGPVLLPESPCHKTEHPLIPHSGELSNEYMPGEVCPWLTLFWHILLYKQVAVIHLLNFQ